MLEFRHYAPPYSSHWGTKTHRPSETSLQFWSPWLSAVPCQVLVHVGCLLNSPDYCTEEKHCSVCACRRLGHVMHLLNTNLRELRARVHIPRGVISIMMHAESFFLLCVGGGGVSLNLSCSVWSLWVLLRGMRSSPNRMLSGVKLCTSELNMCITCTYLTVGCSKPCVLQSQGLISHVTVCSLCPSSYVSVLSCSQ